jgi:tRNA G18 (ribose-2'-O)-methylase SpoU
LCDEIIYIPINNKIDSLNIASSVSIVLWELNRKI